MTLYDALLVMKGIGEQTLNKLQMNNIYNGNLLAMLLNVTPRKSNRTYKWTDFYRDLTKEEKHEMTGDDIHSMLHAMFGGNDNAA